MNAPVQLAGGDDAAFSSVAFAEEVAHGLSHNEGPVYWAAVLVPIRQPA